MKTKQLISSIGVLIATVLFSVSAIMCFCYMETIRQDQIFREMDHGYGYYRLQQESNPMEADVDTYQSLLEQLQSNESYTYYEFYLQPLNSSGGESFYEYGSEQLVDGEAFVLSLQLSENLQHDLSLSVCEGRLLSSGDFWYRESDTIPVLMGYDYIGLYQIGDTFSSEYLYDEYPFQIVGFLSSDSAIYNSIYQISFDRYIVIPSFSVTTDISQTDGLKIHYANKTSGLVRTQWSRSAEVENDILTQIEQANAGQYTLSSSSLAYNFQKNVGVGLYPCFYISLLLSIVFLLIALAILFLRAKRNTTTNSVFRSVLYFVFTTALTMVILYVPVAALLNLPLYFIRFVFVPIIISVLMLLFQYGVTRYFRTSAGIK